MNKILSKIFLIIIVLLGSSSSILALSHIQLDDSLSAENISRYLEYIEDPKKELAIQDIADNVYLGWLKLEGNNVNFGYTKSQLWFRFTVNNLTHKTFQWLLEIDYPLIDMIDLYIPDKSGRFIVKKAGDCRTFKSRDVKDITYIFRIKQKPGPATYFICIKSSDPVNFNLNMLSHSSYLARLNKDLAIYWMYFGLMLIMVVYSLGIFTLIRDREYFYFACFIICVALFEFSMMGFASMYFWPGSTWVPSHANPILGCMVIVTFDLFVCQFVEFGKQYPKINHALLRIIFTAAPLLSVISLFTDLRSGFFPVYVFAMCNVIFSIAMGIYMSFIQKSPSRQARMILLAFSLYGISVPVVIFTLSGYLPNNFFTKWIMQIGTSTAIILLSLGMADKINIMKSFIQKAERQYRYLVESTKDIIFTLDDSNNIMSINNAVNKLLGFDPAELVNTNFLDLIQESKNSRYNMAKDIALEYISDVKRKKEGNSQFRATLKVKYSHEPKELVLNLEYTGDKGTGYAILGKASPVLDDLLSDFLKTERYTYNLNNYLSNAELMSLRLVRNLSKFTDPEIMSDIRIALREAIINSIEHGNLNLSFEEKTQFQLDGNYFEMIRERQMDPAFNGKKVNIEYSLNEKRVIYKITDQGNGFNYEYMIKMDQMETDNITLAHGRGLLLIKNAFDVVKFNKKGNQILLIKYFNKP